ncbi:MAG: patatin-like phospholipase family protein [Nitrospirae bacterium]|nr:patatin-like phospholipase family protein [Nitrospirota bacterium]
MAEHVAERQKTGLVLAGGGIPGWVYEIGALTALDDFFEDGFCVNDFDIFVGTSAGAAVASLMANGVRPRDVFDVIISEKEHPFNFQRKDIYGIAWFGIAKSWANIIKKVYSLLKYYWKTNEKIALLDIIHAMQESSPQGIFKLDNFDRFLAATYEKLGITNDFRNLKRELYIPATDLDIGRYDIFGEEGFADVPISKAVIASSALPIVFEPVHIKDKDYVDGGVGRVAHIDIALTKGAKLILVVNPVVYITNDRKTLCIPTLDGRCATIKEKGIFYIADQAMRVNTTTRLYLAFKRYKNEHPDVEFLQIQPKSTESVLFMYNVLSFKARRELAYYAYESTARLLKENHGELKRSFDKYNIRVSLKKLEEQARKLR